MDQTDALAVLGRILENSRVAITIADRQGKLTLFNAAAERLTGFRSAEVIGRDLSMFYPDQEAMAAIAARVAAEGKVEDHETLLQGKDGEQIPISILVTALHDHLGEAMGSLGITVDLRERRRLEHELLRAKQQADFYNDLMCHDIRNFSHTLLGYLEMLMSGTVGEITSEQRRILGVCKRQVMRTAELIDRVRLLATMAPVDAETLTTQDLGEAADRAARAVREAYADRAPSIEVQLPRPHEVRADPLLQELLYNLISNGVCHNPARDAHVWVSWRGPDMDEAQGQIIVEDDGPGIPDHRKESVFNRFTELQASGTGVGLSLVKAVVKRFGGKVWVEDRVAGAPDQGARFVVAWPGASS